MEDWAKLAMSSSVPVFASIDLIVNLDDMQKATLKTKAAFCINCRLTFDKAKNGDYYSTMISRSVKSTPFITRRVKAGGP